MKKTTKFIGRIIGVGLSGFLLKPLTALFNLVSWNDGWNWLIKPNISYFAVIIGIIICIAFYYIFLFLIPKPKKENRLEKELKKFNYLEDNKNGLKITWDVEFGIYDTDPFACNMKIFCLKHGSVPLLMNHGYCTHPDCFGNSVDEHSIKNYINSLLIDEWNQLNKRTK